MANLSRARHVAVFAYTVRGLDGIRRLSVSGLGTMRDRLEVLRHRLPLVVSPATAPALERDRWQETPGFPALS